MKLTYFIAVITLVFSSVTNAALISVAGPASSAGTSPAIIGAPAHALDDVVTNTGMQGFNEAQGVLTTVAHTTDSGVIAAGTLVDSHMIFLNSAGTSLLSHFNVDWTFATPIIGIMSDSGGLLEAASTFELGAPGTNYTTVFGGSGPAAPFPARGLEGGGDSLTLMGLNVLRVSMNVSEPGDWIRVITASAVPLPAAVWLFGTAILGLLGLGKRKITA